MIDPRILPLGLHRHPFFDLDRGMQTGGPAAIHGDTSFELIHGFDGAILDDVIHVTSKQRVRVQRILNGAEQGKIFHREHVAMSERSLNDLDSVIGERNVTLILLDGEIETVPQGTHGEIGTEREIVDFGVSSGYHQRNARFVNKDGIRFVDEGGAKRAMNAVFAAQRELVAQEIEADFIGGCVGYVTCVGGLSLRRRHVLLNAAHSESETCVDTTHPLRVAARQVVVDRHHMNTRTSLREPDNSGDGGQRLPFPRLHFREPSCGESERAFDLHIEHPQPERPFGHNGRDRNHFVQLVRFMTSRTEFFIRRVRKPGAQFVNYRDRTIAIRRAQKTAR